MTIIGKHCFAALMVSLVAIASYAQITAAQDAPLGHDIPAGHYVLDKTHSTLIFKVSHLGFSFYTAAFSRFDATLELDPQDLENAELAATIDLSSLTLPAPPEGFLKELLGPKWLNATAFPHMTYRSRKVEPTGDNTARVIGDLTLNGTTAPVMLEVTFNGGYPGMPGFDPQARTGFSARGNLNRSAFGISLGIPEEGSTMGVGDQVEFIIETEFMGPPLPESTPDVDG